MIGTTTRCPACGANNEQMGRFCPECGNRLTVVPPTANIGTQRAIHSGTPPESDLQWEPTRSRRVPEPVPAPGVGHDPSDRSIPYLKILLLVAIAGLAAVTIYGVLNGFSPNMTQVDKGERERSAQIGSGSDARPFSIARDTGLTETNVDPVIVKAFTKDQPDHSFKYYVSQDDVDTMANRLDGTLTSAGYTLRRPPGETEQAPPGAPVIRLYSKPGAHDLMLIMSSTPITAEGWSYYFRLPIRPEDLQQRDGNSIQGQKSNLYVVALPSGSIK